MKLATDCMKYLLSCLFAILPWILISQQIYISDAGNFNKPPWQILKCNKDGSNVEVFIKDKLSWPQDILFLEDQNIVLVSNLSTGKITSYDSDTGKFIGNFATEILGPTRIKIGPDGLLYVLQWRREGKILRYKLDGTFVDVFSDTGVNSSIGLDWDSKGQLYVSSYREDYVRKYDSNGQDLGAFVSSDLEGPTNIWFDNDDNLYVVDYDGSAVKKFDVEGRYLGVYVEGLGKSEGVAFFSDGNWLLGNGASHSVKIINSAGTILRDLFDPGEKSLLTPNAVVIRRE